MKPITGVIGAYEPRVQLEDGTKQGLVEYIADLAQERAGTGSKRQTFTLQSQYNPSLSYLLSPAGDDWVSVSPGAGGIRRIYVPSLQEMGLDPSLYELEAQASAVALNISVGAVDVNIRALDPANNVVAGSTGTLNTPVSSVEKIVKSDFFKIDGGAAYFVDAQTSNVGGNSYRVNLGRMRITIRAVRK